MDHFSKNMASSSNIGRFVSGFPTADRRISPQGSNKYIQPTRQPHTFDSKQRDSLHPTFFTSDQSPISSYDRARRCSDEDLIKMSLSEVSLELDNNTNEMLYLINRRKQLLAVKRRKIKQQFCVARQEATKSRHSKDLLLLGEDEQVGRLSWFTVDPQQAGKVISHLMRQLPNLDDKKHLQSEKSKDFWNLNKKYQNDMDVLLSKLKQIDYNLQKQTNEVGQICRTLDSLQDALKQLLIKKSDDHLKKAEPLFINKKKTYDLLNSKIYERQRIKDEKIEYIRKIRDSLSQLKAIREKRVKELYGLFAVDDELQADTKINFFAECAEGLEEIVKLREKSQSLDSTERQLVQEIDSVAKQQESLHAQLIKKQSDEARAFLQYEKIVRKKAKYSHFLHLFSEQVNTGDLSSLYSSDNIRKYREYRQMLKEFVQQDRLIKEGLRKTGETSRTFTNILKSTESEKERRKELLNLLETCSKLKNDEQHKKQMVRGLTVETAKKAQQKNHIEDELENVMTDGDLDSYKKVGNALSKCDGQIEKLEISRRNLEIQIDSINRQIVSIASTLKREYDDILRDILPTNFDLNLRTSDDIKQIKNYIRKTYKRLGLIPNTTKQE